MPSFPKNKLAAPFPWAGGKVMQSDLVWSRFGKVTNYVEPFAGSLGVLLNRPAPFRGVETINDADGFVVNFWRATKAAPLDVAAHADHPVTSVDLWARHDWLVTQRATLTAQLVEDPEWFDAKIAGWWAWGLCAWIGSGWCADTSSAGTHRQRVHTGNAGMGLHSKTARQRVHTGDAAPGSGWLMDLHNRLRDVRILCGDWTQAVQSGVLRYGSCIAVYLDPPYAKEAKRHKDLYSVDSETVAHDVRAWAVENGENPKMRIALAGYEAEHDMPETWECVPWKPHGHGYAAQGADTQGKRNVTRERVWFSPHCLRPEQRDLL